MDEEELEEIRRRKLMEMQARLEEQQRQEELKRQFEIQKRQILQRILTPEARSRLANLKTAHPELAEQLELQLIQLAQSGRLPIPLTDSQFKSILSKLAERRREIKIRRL